MSICIDLGQVPAHFAVHRLSHEIEIPAFQPCPKSTSRTNRRGAHCWFSSRRTTNGVTMKSAYERHRAKARLSSVPLVFCANARGVLVFNVVSSIFTTKKYCSVRKKKRRKSRGRRRGKKAYVPGVPALSVEQTFGATLARPLLQNQYLVPLVTKNRLRYSRERAC